nr:septal ring lytic transglycosylase RlpA family protein [Rhizobium paknamense]
MLVIKAFRPVTVCFRGVALACFGLSLAACSTTHDTSKINTPKKRSKEYFAESAYGVKASPRVVENGPVPKGGGRRLVGDPYVVAGKVYTPRENPNYEANGLASWYGSAFHGRYTANGEVYDQYSISAAHPTMPLPSYARVTNTDTGSSVIVRVNDRGPFHEGRLIDLSEKAAELLDVKGHGTAHVKVKYVGPADMSGHDMPYLMASYTRKGERVPLNDPMLNGNVMVASNSSPLQSFFGRFAGPTEPSRPAAKTSKPTVQSAPTVAYNAPQQPAVRAAPPVQEAYTAPKPVVAQAPVAMPQPVQRTAIRAELPPVRQAAVAPAPQPVYREPARASVQPQPVQRSKPAAIASAPAPQPMQKNGLPPGWNVGPQPVKVGSAYVENDG